MKQTETVVVRGNRLEDTARRLELPPAAQRLCRLFPVGLRPTPGENMGGEAFLQSRFRLRF